MNGEMDLKILLATMQPVLLEARYVFCTVKQEQYDELALKPLGTFREQEGITLIITEEQASQAGLPYDSSWACISLMVHSSLSAIGFLSVLTSRLAQAHISVNAVSAFYHDHLFVPWESRETAMKVLEATAAAGGIKP
jgi:hypothetical protein